MLKSLGAVSAAAVGAVALVVAAAPMAGATGNAAFGNSCLNAAAAPARGVTQAGEGAPASMCGYADLMD
ncbi:hypothetical protein [Streptomyces sp. WM6378]|uniref:hypothetical protein n=1 Tax=Streptomyces sp. WM6378 TaxID=1415557 RepID=UPI0006AF55BB|nr:hypothetical protein [Streptomyces sp. WM6378]KOU38066.1 hypothetical protein ADK54_30165 [Streptomyces sp. WM6378]